ncbi:hypothetical protein [Teredinibacter haidensis]|uniref:hypothetical protein n=1 Tax=Teredinibacter haidensis TaxID=2731755 RepID=UPI000948F1FB|nr:hypothetical protein [Teredinibacter haidensis]
MVQKNRLDVKISEADLADINAAIATLNDKLAPHLISLSSEERMALPKMGDRTKAFVEKARVYAGQYPNFLPNFVSLDAFDNDLATIGVLGNVLRGIQPLTSNLEDSHLLAGSEAYQAALIYYRSIKMASESGIPNASAIYKDLSRRFDNRSRSKTPAETEEVVA